jgi:hypothetical protein
MSCHAADDRAAASTKDRACGVIVPAAGIRHSRHGGCAKNDDGGHYHRSSLFQHGILPSAGKHIPAPT